MNSIESNSSVSNMRWAHHGPRVIHYNWEGLDLLTLENERIRITYWLGHGGDLIEFRHKASDLDVLWKNPRSWPPKKRAVDQPHKGSSEFYDVFHGGWFVSLPNGFFPADYYGASLGCHGELQSSPWTYEITEWSAGTVRVRMEGRCTRTPWVVTREVELNTNASIVSWSESLRNVSANRLPVAWLQHPAFGGPFIEGAQIITSAKKILTPPSDRPELNQLKPSYSGDWPYAEEDDGNLRDCSIIASTGSATEHVIHMADFPVGWGSVWNDAHDLGFGIRWDESLFPYAWSWNCGSGANVYPLWGSCHTVTIQPSTSPLLPFEKLLNTDQLIWVEGGQARTARFTSGFFDKIQTVFPLKSTK